MRHGNPGAVRTLVAIGKVLAHDCRPRLGHVTRQPDRPGRAIGCKPLGRPMGREGDRRLPLPALALAADVGKFDVPDRLGDRPERRAGADRLKLLVIADQDELRPAHLRLPDETGELPASNHTGLVDHQHVAPAELVTLVLPTPIP